MGLKFIQQLRDWIYKRRHGEMRYKMKSGQVKRGDVMVESRRQSVDLDNDGPTLYIVIGNDTENEILTYEIIVGSIEEVTSDDYEPFELINKYPFEDSYAHADYRDWKHISMSRLRISFNIGENRNVECTTHPRDIEFPTHE